MVNTRFWDDNYVSNLDPIEKLLFLYFLTNTSTNICGIYEIPIKKVANETGIDKEMVEKIIKRFSRDKKIYYKNGWIGIVNFIKNQNQQSPQVKKGIERELEQVPNDLKLIVLEGIDTLSHLTKPNLTKLNLTKPKVDSEQSSQVISIIDEFKKWTPVAKRWYVNKTQREACKDLIEAYGFDQVMRVIPLLPKTNKKPFLPTATTPLQLFEKYTALQAGLERLKSESDKLQNKTGFIL